MIITDPVLDPNIGRSWKSPYGQQTIASVDRIPAGDYYEVRDPSGAVRIYRGDELESRIRRDEHESSPEFAAEQAARQAARDGAESQRKEREAAEARQIADIDAFVAATGLSALAAGKARASLQKQFRFDGKVLARKTKIEQLVAEGASIASVKTDAIQPMSRRQFNRATLAEQEAHDARRTAAGQKTVYFVGGFDVGKIGYDYALYVRDVVTAPAATAFRLGDGGLA